MRPSGVSEQYFLEPSGAFASLLLLRRTVYIPSASSSKTKPDVGSDDVDLQVTAAGEVVDDEAEEQN
jgi:hypothetical protein